MGDTLQFCRYAPLVAQRGARVLLEVQPALAGLLRGLAGVSEVLQAGDALPPVDLHCPLMSLPLAFGTTLHTIPAAEGYLNCSPDKLQAWRERLGPCTQPRVGLVWSGNPAYKADSRRSLPLEQLLQHLPEGIEYISLQKDVRERDLPALSTSRLRHFGAEHQDFADSAALCELVDVVVSVDTSGAHLAGALGRPTWLLVAHTPDWRWLLHRSDSTWYRSVKLFRQGPDRQWESVLREMARELHVLPPSIRLRHEA